MELLKKDIKLQRERDRGEKSTGENGETINYLFTLPLRREKTGKNGYINIIFLCHIVNKTT